MPLIQLRAVTKLYRMGESVVRALDGVDLDIERGEFLAITGPSGSGKSTMMHVIGCLDRPTSGTYLLDGRAVNDRSDRELAAIRNGQIGFVFQTFNLINRTTALDNVGVPLFYARRSNSRGPARQALERVGLSHRCTHRPSELSGGERQRVAIARAIVNHPSVLLADEPTGNLDTRTGEQIMELFGKLNAQGVTIVLVTHEHDVAVQARRIVQMRDGRIVSDRPTREILADRAGRKPTEVSPPDLAEAPVAGSDGPAPQMLALAGSARLVRGATAALVCGVLAPLLALTAWIGGSLIRVPKMDPSGRQLPPTPILVAGLSLLACWLLAVVLGIVAVAASRGALRRIANEPGNWLGARRARTALLLGWLAILAPVLSITVGIVWR